LAKQVGTKVPRELGIGEHILRDVVECVLALAKELGASLGRELGEGELVLGDCAEGSEGGADLALAQAAKGLAQLTEGLALISHRLANGETLAYLLLARAESLTNEATEVLETTLDEAVSEVAFLAAEHLLVSWGR